VFVNKGITVYRGISDAGNDNWHEIKKHVLSGEGHDICLFMQVLQYFCRYDCGDNVLKLSFASKKRPVMSIPVH
jgi:hypothetical protein